MAPVSWILACRELWRPRRRIVRRAAHAHRRRRLQQIEIIRGEHRRVLPERRDVVENPEAAAVRRSDRDRSRGTCCRPSPEIANGDGGHVELERLPVIAIVVRHPHLRVGGRVEQPLHARILANRVRDGTRRDTRVDLCPALAAVVRAPEDAGSGRRCAACSQPHTRCDRRSVPPRC